MREYVHADANQILLQDSSETWSSRSVQAEGERRSSPTICVVFPPRQKKDAKWCTAWQAWQCTASVAEDGCPFPDRRESASCIELKVLFKFVAECVYEFTDEW